MKRFHWPLERLLVVTGQRELALRSELIDLMRRITQTRQEIVTRNAEMRSMLSDLSDLSIEDRIVRQEVFMRFSAWSQRRIDQLREKINQLKSQRVEKTTQLITLRKKKETLERSREDARQAHIREQMKLEQKEFDSNAQIAFVREATGVVAGV